MLLRVHVDERDGVSTLHLVGRLDDEGLVELQKTYEACKARVELELSELRSVDDVGAAYLRGLVDAGVRVTHFNPYMAALLCLGGQRRRSSRRRAKDE